MNLIINYPTEMTQPKGLHLPKVEDVQQTVKFAELVASYVNLDYEDDEAFTVMVTDEIDVSSDGRLINCYDTGEGIILHPSVSTWTVEAIFELILTSLFGEKGKTAMIPIVNLAEIAEGMKTLINFIWNLQGELPLIEDFCNKHDDIMDISISLSEKASTQDRGQSLGIEV